MGPNGAGKTTVFNLLTGVYEADSGSVMFKDKEIINDTPAKRCRNGIGRTYQIPRQFDKMTVYENLLVGAVHGGGMSEKKARPKVLDILDMIDLMPQKDILAGGLPLLDRKALELGRALATQPELILLDEIAGGLTEKEAHQVLGIVKKIWEQGMTIIWIEHILAMMSEGADRLLVITQGRFLKCGEPQDVMNSDEVMECYLGAED
jgi:branched-chain amino acid transport system ATP-binding protein